MLIVISDPAFRNDEAGLINAMFENGLQLFHLRKPNARPETIETLLRNIDAMYHSRISLHQHYQIASEFGITRIHHPEKIRQEMNQDEWQSLKEKGMSLSTSIHELNEQVAPEYDYAFFGPVFNSISKKDYYSTMNEHAILTSGRVKQIAIGGIDQMNCAQAFAMGFDGVAILGAIWESDDVIHSFKKIQNACSCLPAQL